MHPNVIKNNNPRRTKKATALTSSSFCASSALFWTGCGTGAACAGTTGGFSGCAAPSWFSEGAKGWGNCTSALWAIEEKNSRGSKTRKRDPSFTAPLAETKHERSVQLCSNLVFIASLHPRVHACMHWVVWDVLFSRGLFSHISTSVMSGSMFATIGTKQVSEASILRTKLWSNAWIYIYKMQTQDS